MPSRIRSKSAQAGKPAARAIPFKRMLAWSGLCLLALIVLAAIVAEWRFGVLRTGARVDRARATEGSAIVAVVDPAELTGLARAEIEQIAGWPVPAWVARRLMPHEAGLAAALDLEQQRVDIRVYVNPKGLLPVARRYSETLKFSEGYPQIRWKRGAEEPAPGLLVKHGVVAFAREAEEAFWYTWNQSIGVAGPDLEGGHLFEMVMDNRRGHAFLVVASMLEAFDIHLDAEKTDISLSSLQFVREARLTADLTRSDSLRIRFVLEILPDDIEKLGVVNLKVGIDELFEEIGTRWRRDHGLRLEGESAWDGTRIVYEYRLSSARKAFHLLVTDQLRFR